jgi:hypothetical protein
MKAPKVNVATKKENVVVRQIVVPNFWKNNISVVRRKLPLPKDVRYPLKMLTPMCLYDYLILRLL